MLNPQPLKRLGDILKEAGIVTNLQLKQALATPRLPDERIGDVLIRLGYVSEEEIISTLSVQLKIPAVKLNDYPVSQKAVNSIPEHLAKRYSLIPVDLKDNKLTVAMSDPLDLTALDDIRLFTGYEPLTVISSRNEISKAIERYYNFSYSIQKISDQVASTKRGGEQVKREMAATGIIEDSEQAPAVRLVDLAIRQAVEQRASDIHFEPREEGVIVRYRVDGILRDGVVFPGEVAAAVISRVKIMANMDIAEKRLPQDGRITFLKGSGEVDLRASTLPTILGEKVVLRILDKSQGIINISRLGMPKEHLQRFKKMLAYPYGMVLATGPTGSGKTTTLYSGLETINNPDKNIITVEDPVEYTLPGINQVQVNVKAGLSFANGLRALLRQDPDVVMVGEIRDLETADIAIRSAMTGHLVLSTLHTNNAVSTIARLLDMQIEPFLISSALLGIISQRLVRIVCTKCRVSYPAEDDQQLSFFLSPEEYQGKRLYKAVGCPECFGTGYRGRIGIYEVLEINERIRELIALRAGTEQIRKEAKKAGMVSMFKDGLDKAFAGVTTLAEVMRVTFADEEVR